MCRGLMCTCEFGACGFIYYCWAIVCYSYLFTLLNYVCVLLVLLVMVFVFFTGCFNLPPSLSSATMIHVLYGSASRNFQLLSSTEVIEVCWYTQGKCTHGHTHVASLFLTHSLSLSLPLSLLLLHPFLSLSLSFPYPLLCSTKCYTYMPILLINNSYTCIFSALPPSLHHNPSSLVPVPSSGIR